jgi:hypothetical protein
MVVMSSLALACTCGAVRGTLRHAEPAQVNRVVCYCDDCQTFAAALGRADVLDGFGGTDIVQAYPCNVTITEGREHVALLRLSPKGLLRFHTACCRAPLANTMPSPRAPFLGLNRKLFAADADAAFGPPIGGVQAKFARGRPPGASDTLSAGVMARTAWFLGRGALFGRHAPSPVRDAAGAPIVQARVLSREERDASRPASG